MGYPRILTEPGGGTATLERPSTGDSSGTDGWFTIKGRPESCPCGHSSQYVCEPSRPHRVVVWPSATDPMLVKALRSIRCEGDVCEVVEYERSFGPCVSYYALTPS